MRRIGLGLAIGIWWAAAASASTDIRDVDQNGDGFASFAELTAVFDGATEIDFRNIDANSDSRISAIEIQSEVARMVLSRQAARQSTFSEVSAVDTDGDNVVTFSEPVDAYSGLSAVDPDRIAASEFLAVNGEGAI